MVTKKTNNIFNKDPSTLKLIGDADIAMDFGKKVYERFDKLVKCVVLFGSTVKKTASPSSDLDIVVIVDDCSVKFDQELVAWYREEMGKIVMANPYKREIHINTIKLTTWWQDLLRGDPVVTNIIRYGEEIIDVGGFFRPLRVLLQDGKIKSTPEAIYAALQRSPIHLANSKRALIGAVEGLYWAMTDSAHALLMAARITPPSPEQIAPILREEFVKKKQLDSKYADWYGQMYDFYKQILHNQLRNISGKQIDELEDKTQKFISAMASAIERIL